MQSPCLETGNPFYIYKLLLETFGECRPEMEDKHYAARQDVPTAFAIHFDKTAPGEIENLFLLITTIFEGSQDTSYNLLFGQIKNAWAKRRIAFTPTKVG